MSAGMIWYKTQPDSTIASVVEQQFSGMYGDIISHDITVHPNKIGHMISTIFSRSDTVIIVGGLNTVKFEENIIYILSRVLGIPTENGKFSRSKHCCNTIRGTQLPSLAGSILFPSRFGGPEGIFLRSGNQTIIVLPADTLSAKAIVASMQKFLASRVKVQKPAAVVTKIDNSRQNKDYRKFENRSSQKRISTTREYDEFELQNIMENAIGDMRRREGRISESMSDDYNRNDRDDFKFTPQERRDLQKRAKTKKVRNVFSLSLVIIVLCLLIAVGKFADIPTFASSVSSNGVNSENVISTTTISSGEHKNNETNITETPSTTQSKTSVTDEQTEKKTTTTSEKVTSKKTTSTVKKTTTKKKTVKKTTTSTKKTTSKKSTTTTKKAITTSNKATSQSAVTTSVQSSSPEQTTHQSITDSSETTASTTSTTSSTTKKTTTTTKAKAKLTMRIKSNGKIVSGDAVTILASIIEAEMGSSYNIEALKAQTVAAYTFYLYSGGSAKAPSFPTKTPGARAKNAAKAVLGKRMKYNGKTPYTPYYAISAGKTASNATVNGTALAHLKSVDCSSDKKASGYKKIKTYSAAQVAKKVKSNTGINLYSISNKNKWFSIVKRDSNGLYVEKVKVGNKTYRGSNLWLSILGYSYLRSPCYYISYNSESDTFTFTSYGYGHCVGMSQKGANAYAAQGKDYKWILKHFYGGVTIS